MVGESKNTITYSKLWSWCFY